MHPEGDIIMFYNHALGVVTELSVQCINFFSGYTSRLWCPLSSPLFYPSVFSRTNL